MADEEYEIVSHKQVQDLKKKIENLKGNAKNTVSNDELKTSIDDLNSNLKIMIEVFGEANRMLKVDEQEALTLSQNMGPLIDKIDRLLEQNQTVAKGIITVADLVRDKLTDLEAATPAPAIEDHHEEIRQPSMMPSPLPDASGRAYPPSTDPYPSAQPLTAQTIPPISPPSQQTPMNTLNSIPMESHEDLQMNSNMPPLPRGQPSSLGPNIQPPPVGGSHSGGPIPPPEMPPQSGKKPLFAPRR